MTEPTNYTGTTYFASYRLRYKVGDTPAIPIACLSDKTSENKVPQGRRSEKRPTTPKKVVAPAKKPIQTTFGKKTGNDVKPTYITGMSLDGWIALVSKSPTAIRKSWRPAAIVQLAAVRKNLRARHWINGPIDESVQIYIRHRLHKNNRYTATNDNVVTVKSAGKPAENSKPSAKTKAAETQVLTPPNDQSRAKAFDQYYTPSAMAQFCADQVMQILPANQNYAFFEPSAGGGVFLDAVKTFGPATGIDIDPMRPDIPMADFLTDNVTSFLPEGSTPENLVLIGNPPFGKKGSTLPPGFNPA